MFSAELRTHAETLLAAARVQGLKLATAESCTGGLIAGLLTEIPGSSDVVERGFVTYSNQAKDEMLGVPAAMLRQHGAVSEAVAEAMLAAPAATSSVSTALAPASVVRRAAATWPSNA